MNSHVAVSATDFEMLMKKMGIVNTKKRTDILKSGKLRITCILFLRVLSGIFLKGTDEIITHIVKEGGLIASSAYAASGLRNNILLSE
jgi:hypothetical protein